MRLVSICTTTFDHEEYIEEAIRSALSQDHSEIELVIVDDGSSDATVEKIRKFKDGRIKLVAQDNKGPSSALNKSIECASGEFIALFSGDDVCHRDRISRQIEHLERTNDDFLFSRPQLIDNQSKLLPDANASAFFQEKIRDTKSVLRALILGHNPLCAPTAFGKASSFRRIGKFHNGLIQLQDYEYWIRACQSSRISVISDRLVSYRIRQNGANLSSNKNSERIRNEHQYVVDRLQSYVSIESLCLAFPEWSDVLRECESSTAALNTLGFALFEGDRLSPFIRSLIGQLATDEEANIGPFRFKASDLFRLQTKVVAKRSLVSRKPFRLLKRFLGVHVSKGPETQQTKHVGVRDDVLLSAAKRKIASTLREGDRGAIQGATAYLKHHLGRDFDVMHGMVACDEPDENLITQQCEYKVLHTSGSTTVRKIRLERPEGRSRCVENGTVFASSRMRIEQGVIKHPILGHPEDCDHCPDVWPVAVRDGRYVALVFNKEKKIELDAGIYIGCEAEANYFHWVTEVMTKAVEAGNLKGRYSPLLVSSGLHNNLYQALEKIIDDENIVKIPPRSPLLIKRGTVIAEQSRALDVYNRSPREESDIVLGQSNLAAVRRLCSKNKKNDLKIFLRRGNSVARKLTNEVELSEIARQKGFKTVDTSLLSFDEQVDLFGSARVIVGPTGAAFTNLLFAGSGCKALILVGDHPSANLSIFPQVGIAANADVTIGLGTRQGGMPPKYSIHDNFHFDAKIFERWVSQNV